MLLSLFIIVPFRRQQKIPSFSRDSYRSHWLNRESDRVGRDPPYFTAGAVSTVFPVPRVPSGAHWANSIVPSNVPVKLSKKPLPGGLADGARIMACQVLTMVPVAPAKRPVPPLTSKVVCPLFAPVAGSRHAWLVTPGLRRKKSCSRSR